MPSLLSSIKNDLIIYLHFRFDRIDICMDRQGTSHSLHFFAMLIYFDLFCHYFSLSIAILPLLVWVIPIYPTPIHTPRPDKTISLTWHVQVLSRVLISTLLRGVLDNIHIWDGFPGGRGTRKWQSGSLAVFAQKVLFDIHQKPFETLLFAVYLVVKYG